MNCKKIATFTVYRDALLIVWLDRLWQFSIHWNEITYPLEERHHYYSAEFAEKAARAIIDEWRKR